MREEGCTTLLCYLAFLAVLLATDAAALISHEATDHVKAIVELMHRDNPQSPLRPPHMNDTNFFSIWAQRDALRLAQLRKTFLFTPSDKRLHPTSTESLPPTESLAIPLADAVLSEWQQPLSAGHTGGYILDLKLGGSAGGPAHQMTVLMDTASEMTWVQCQPCENCIPQNDPIYQPLKSYTFAKVSCQDRQCNMIAPQKRYCDKRSNTCMYRTSFMDGSQTTGFVGLESVGLGTWEEDQVLIMCSTLTRSSTLRGPAGILALGKGPISIPSLHGSSFQNFFAYCLPRPFSTDRGYLRLGGESSPTTIGMLKHPLAPNLYFVPLIGLGVNYQALQLKPDVFDIDPFQEEKVSGVFVDSAATLTRFPPAVYKVLRGAIRKAMKASGYAFFPASPELDTCFNLPNKDITLVPGLPSVQLFFEDEITLSLDTHSIFQSIPGSTPFGKVEIQCFMFGPGAPGDLFSVIGNIQLQGYEWSFDLRQQEIGFRRAACGT